MGHSVDPTNLTMSGERCLQRLNELNALGLPSPQFITAAATVVEVHVSRIIATLITLSSASDSLLGEAMLEDLHDAFVATWPARVKWLKVGFNISIGGSLAYQDFDRLVEARNAIAHGDGQFTDRQTKNLKRLLELRKVLLKKFEITTNGRLGFSGASTSKVLESMRTFVADFDAKVIDLYPLARRH